MKGGGKDPLQHQLAGVLIATAGPKHAEISATLRELGNTQLVTCLI